MGNCRSIQSFTHLEFAQGDSYEGEMLDGMAEGWGIYTKVDGDKYIGWWHLGLQHGYGQELYTDGTEYVGMFLSGKKHGEGVIKFPDGSSYEGGFENDCFSGYGVYTYENGAKYYGNSEFTNQGKWESNKKEGMAKIVFENGNCFTCNYRDDRRNGESIFEWVDGYKFECRWMDNEIVSEQKYYI